MGLIFTIFASLSANTIKLIKTKLRKFFGLFTMAAGLYIFLKKEH